MSDHIKIGDRICLTDGTPVTLLQAMNFDGGITKAFVESDTPVPRCVNGDPSKPLGMGKRFWTPANGYLAVKDRDGSDDGLIAKAAK